MIYFKTIINNPYKNIFYFYCEYFSLYNIPLNFQIFFYKMNLISLSIFLCFISFFWKDSFNSSKLCCISFLRTLNILLLSLISIIGSLILIRGLFILWFITKSKKSKRCIFYFIIFKKIINFKIVYILSKQKKIIISRIFRKK